MADRCKCGEHRMARAIQLKLGCRGTVHYGDDAALCNVAPSGALLARSGVTCKRCLLMMAKNNLAGM